jgi:hypothetical protein
MADSEHDSEKELETIKSKAFGSDVVFSRLRLLRQQKLDWRTTKGSSE